MAKKANREGFGFLSHGSIREDFTERVQRSVSLELDRGKIVGFHSEPFSLKHNILFGQNKE